MSLPRDAGGPALNETQSGRAPTWPRVAVVVAVLVGAFLVSRSCGTSDIKTSQDEALAKATAEADFEPEDTQIRLLRQGIDRHPFWIVSMSTLSPNGQAYTDLAVARVDATSGEIVEFREQKDAKRGADQAP